MKKKLSISSILTNLMLAMFVGVATAMLTAVSPILVAVGVFAVGTAPQVLFGAQETSMPGAFYAGLQKEVWVDQLLEDFHPDNSFYLDGEDWSEHVENDKINFAIIGADPNVEVNRTTYPIPITERTDTDGDVELDEFSSDSTLVKDAEAIELSYKKMESVLSGHRRTIREKYANKAQWGIAPNVNSANTPVWASTGPLRANGFRAPSEADLIKLAEYYDDMEAPMEGRVLLLTNSDYWGIIENVPALAKQYERQKQGTIGSVVLNIHGFEIKKRNKPALYKIVGGEWTKQPFGTAPAADTFAASISYIKNTSFVYCDGTTKMYDKIDDPDYQGSYVNFRHRGLVAPKRQKYLSAFVGVNS